MIVITVKEDESLLNGIILPELGARKIAGIGFRDVEALHLGVTKNGAPDPYHGHKLRYVNPASGEAAMPTIAPAESWNGMIVNSIDS